MTTTVSVVAHGGDPTGAADSSAALVRACRALRHGGTLVIEPGRYRVGRARAGAWHGGIFNHDNGFERRVGLLLQDLDDITVAAAGAALVAQGHVVPLLAERCRNLRVTGLTIDAEHAYHGWGEVVGGWAGWTDVRITGGHPWRIHRERLCFRVDGEDEEMWGVYAMDAQTLRPLPGSGDNCGTPWTVPWIAEALGDGVVRLRTPAPVVPPAGSILVLRHGQRVAPAVCLSEVARATLDGVTVHAASGMGVVCQRSADLTLSRVCVVAAPGRPLSANHDATHFVNCRGAITVEDGEFSRQLDDALNAHGVYTPIVEREGARRVAVRLVHDQQRVGALFARAGDELAVVDPATLAVVGTFTATAAHSANGEFIEIEGALPGAAVPGMVLENLTWRADLICRRNRIEHNRARGLLTIPGGDVLIEDNDICTSGAAIQMQAEASYWYEGGATRSVTVRGNRFTGCGYAEVASWGGRTIVLVNPKAQHVRPDVHGRLVVRDNVLVDCPGPLIEARGVAEIDAAGNTGAGPVIRR